MLRILASFAPLHPTLAFTHLDQRWEMSFNYVTLKGIRQESYFNIPPLLLLHPLPLASWIWEQVTLERWPQWNEFSVCNQYNSLSLLQLVKTSERKLLQCTSQQLNYSRSNVEPGRDESSSIGLISLTSSLYIKSILGSFSRRTNWSIIQTLMSMHEYKLLLTSFLLGHYSRDEKAL